MGMTKGTVKPKKMFAGTLKVKKVAWGNETVWSSGNIVTYHITDAISYTEEIEDGISVLSPSSFSPAGLVGADWDFLGWRTDKTAGSSVLTDKTMGDSPVDLYAVYRKAVTITYYNNSTSANKTTGYRHYNNGNYANPSFKLTQSASSGWTARGWSATNKGNASITYNNGAAFTRESNITLYGLYQQTITLSYAGNGNTGGSTAAQTGTRYWAPAGYINPSFTLRANGFTRTNYTFNGWSTSSSAVSGSAANTSVTLNANTTYYATWKGTAFYVIQNGSLVSGNYTSAVNNYGRGGHTGSDTNFGHSAHGNGTGKTIGPYVAFNTKGCSKMRIVFHNGDGYNSKYAVSVIVATGSIGTQTFNGYFSSKTLTGTVNRNTNASVHFYQKDNSGLWLEATITEIYLYD